jgi:hypothetical protein
MAPGLRDIPEGTNGAASGVFASDRDGGRHGKSWVVWLVSDDPPGRLLLNVIMLVVLAAFVFAPSCSPAPRRWGSPRASASS